MYVNKELPSPSKWSPPNEITGGRQVPITPSANKRSLTTLTSLYLATLTA